MIYKFKTVFNKKKEILVKEIYLTADSKAQFYRRLVDQYGLLKDEVEILDEIDEESIDVNRSSRPKRTNAADNKPKDNIIDQSIKELLENASYLCDSIKNKYKDKYTVIDLTSGKELSEINNLKKKYKKVKVYFNKKFKQKVYFALVK